jgi:acetoin utilization deacetylase AcuC-like enzyme
LIASLPVFYSPKMVADAGSFSPSASKPKHVIESWRKLGIPMTVIEPGPVTDAEFCLAHDEGFVEGVLTAKDENGFGNKSQQVAASLPFTSGAMLAAAREALRNHAVAVAPCSGFHHARFEAPGGYCTFNGLVVTAQVLKTGDEVRRVGILDFDQHYGDGTDDIVQHLGLDYIEHYTAGRYWHSPEQAREFLSLIPSIVEHMADCSVVLYQAGADPHIDDPLGGWLTTTEIARRDRIVFQSAKKARVPVAWNLAGGYQTPLRKVLDIHDNTLRACWQVYGLETRKGGKLA